MMIDYKTLVIARERDVFNGNLSSELCLAHSAYQKGHKVSFMLPEDFYIKDNSLHGITRRPNAEIIRSLDDFVDLLGNERHTLTEAKPLRDYDNILFRVAFKNQEEMTTMQNALGYLASLRTTNPEIAMINDPSGIILAGSKIYETLVFGELLPRTQVTKDASRLKKVMDEARTEGVKLVGKPLDGMGGASVIPLPWESHSTFAELLVQPLGSDHPIPSIIQEEVKGIDRRLFVLGGEIIGGYGRIPKEGDFRANLSTGGILKQYTPQEVDYELVAKMKDSLERDGLHFVGIDVIGPEKEGTLDNTKLIEINVRCPGGIAELDKIQARELSDRVISSMEELSDNLRLG